MNMAAFDKKKFLQNCLYQLDFHLTGLDLSCREQFRRNGYSIRVRASPCVVNFTILFQKFGKFECRTVNLLLQGASFAGGGWIWRENRVDEIWDKTKES